MLEYLRAWYLDHVEALASVEALAVVIVVVVLGTSVITLVQGRKR